MDALSTRVAYGQELAAAGEKNEQIVVLDADLSCCTMTETFAERFPERFINCGISEANMVGIGAGLASCGKIVLVNSFAMFLAGRCFEQIRNSVCYPGLNVKLVGTHAGISVGEDGATHQCIEDIGAMRSIPGLTVVSPSDPNETKEALRAILKYSGPVYFRLGRTAVKWINYPTNTPFELGKARLLREGQDITIIAAGLMVHEALKAATLLRDEGVEARILNMHTIKPIDRDAILKAAHETGGIVTAEEHNVLTGLGSAVAEVLSQECPVRMQMVGMNDCFGRSGTADELMEFYGLTAARIVQEVRKIIE